jgi:hypothetical protein
MTRAASLARAKDVLGYEPRFTMAAAVRDLAEYLEHEQT